MLMLGNLSPEEIAERLKIKFTEEDLAYLKKNRQEKVCETPLKPHAWHCYDIPFMMMCPTRSDAASMYARFKKYKCHGTFQIGYERET